MPNKYLFKGEKKLGIKREETGLNQAKVMKNYILESSFKIIRKQIKIKKNQIIPVANFLEYILRCY